MTTQDFLLQTIKQIEERFNCLAFANWNETTGGKNVWWEIGVDKPNVYGSNEFKAFSGKINEQYKAKFHKGSLLFKLQYATESTLQTLISKGLLLNV